MTKLITIPLLIVALLAGAVAFIWFVNPFDVRDKMLVNQIVKLRVAPKRLENIKNPADYGMVYEDVDIMTEDGVRLSAWEIPAAKDTNKTVIVNHPLTTTRYGSEDGLDGVSAEFLPMVKHLHDAGFNVVMYDHRGQGDSDGGIRKTLKGKEAAVGAGVTEWQDVAASLRHVLAHSEFGDDEIVFLSQCMGANATFLAWQNEPELFSNPQIKAMVANQPTLSYNMTDRFILAKTGIDLVDRVLDAQRTKYGFGFARALDYVPSLSVPVLYAQVEKDEYTFNTETGKKTIFKKSLMQPQPNTR